MAAHRISAILQDPTKVFHSLDLQTSHAMPTIQWAGDHLVGRQCWLAPIEGTMGMVAPTRAWLCSAAAAAAPLRCCSCPGRGRSLSLMLLPRSLLSRLPPPRSPLCSSPESRLLKFHTIRVWMSKTVRAATIAERERRASLRGQEAATIFSTRLETEPQPILRRSSSVSSPPPLPSSRRRETSSEEEES